MLRAARLRRSRGGGRGLRHRLRQLCAAVGADPEVRRAFAAAAAARKQHVPAPETAVGRLFLPAAFCCSDASTSYTTGSAGARELRTMYYEKIGSQA